jgi:hypothetical protein
MSPMKDIFNVNPDLEMAFLKSIVRPYENLNFIKRLMSPGKYGMLPMPEGPGSGGSHLMSYSTDDQGRAAVYPQIIQRSEQHPLERLSANDALKYAIQNKEYIPFDNAQDADWFGKNYKKIGGMY